jgi:hypothetical protein
MLTAMLRHLQSTLKSISFLTYNCFFQTKLQTYLINLKNRPSIQLSSHKIFTYVFCLTFEHPVKKALSKLCIPFKAQIKKLNENCKVH